MRGWHYVTLTQDVRREFFDEGQRWCPILHTFSFFFFVFRRLPFKLKIARSEMYHYGICVRRGARLEGGGDLSATDISLLGNKACMRSRFLHLNGVSMSPGPCVACRFSEVDDLAWPSCIISLLNHVGFVSGWFNSPTFPYHLLHVCTHATERHHKHIWTSIFVRTCIMHSRGNCFIPTNT